LYLLHLLLMLLLLILPISPSFLPLLVFLAATGERIQASASHGSGDEHHAAQDNDHQGEHEPAAQALKNKHRFHLCE